MPESLAFGRRQTSPVAPPRTAVRTSVAPSIQGVPQPLSRKAEAFRAELAASRGETQTSFGDWRRANLKSRIAVWLITLACFSPGLVCFLLQVPPAVSVAVEIAGVMINMQLRRARRRRLKEIVAWSEPADV